MGGGQYGRMGGRAIWENGGGGEGEWKRKRTFAMSIRIRLFGHFGEEIGFPTTRWLLTCSREA